MDIWIPFALIMLAASFTSGMAGFGAALVSMPLLISLLGMDMARPTFALAILVAELFMIALYRKSIDFQAVWRMVVPSLCAIPIGVVATNALPESLTLTILGITILLYALYNLFGFTLPRLTNVNWAFPFGLCSGIFSGAFNISGPPLIIYGDMSRWERNRFKANLQTVFVTNNIMVNITHAATGNHTAETLKFVLIAIPVTIIGILLGKSMDHLINREQFRKIVLILLVVISSRLLWSLFS